MARIVDYAEVTAAARDLGLRSLYHNSGAFGFPSTVEAFHLGWILTPDASIRGEALRFTRQVSPPDLTTLADLAARAWTETGSGPVWILPKAHWAFELDFGSGGWMRQMLQRIGVDPNLLACRNDGAAIEFQSGDVAPFRDAVETLLASLHGSDFALLFPGRPVIATLHHHKQIWWTTSETSVAHHLENLTSAA